MNIQSEPNDRKRNRPLLATPLKRCSLVLHPPRLNERQKTVMVLGVERGGTSMVAGVLRALGVNMGERAGFNHEDPQFLVEDLEKLTRRIRRRNKESDVWGFKVPRLVQHLNFFESNLRNPYYIIVYRNLLAIADSWQQRGAGNAVEVIHHAVDYYGRIMDHCKKTRRPVLMLNYERAVSSDEGKDEAVKALADFLGLEVEPANLVRAIDMITGDGMGYVNLPEHFFAVTAMQSQPDRQLLDLQLRTPELVGPNGWIKYDTFQEKLTFSRPDSALLPSSFWLRVDLEADSSVDLSTCPLRVYFDYIGAFFPAHCARPPVRKGTNYFFVETSGQAKALAFGPLHVPARMRIGAQAYESIPDDENRIAVGAISDNVRRPDAR